MYASTSEFADLEGISYGRAWELLRLGMPHKHLDGKKVIPVKDARSWRAERLTRIGRPRKS